MGWRLVPDICLGRPDQCNTSNIIKSWLHYYRQSNCWLATFIFCTVFIERQMQVQKQTQIQTNKNTNANKDSGELFSPPLMVPLLFIFSRVYILTFLSLTLFQTSHKVHLYEEDRWSRKKYEVKRNLLDLSYYHRVAESRWQRGQCRLPSWQMEF